MVIQKHTKIKDVTWWIVVGTKKDNRLLALRKASVKKKVNLKVQIDLPEDLRKNPVEVYLMADCYVGLDQMTTVKFEIREDSD